MEREKKPSIVRKPNELSENVTFAFEFVLAFEIQSLNVEFFAFFSNAIFSKYSRAEWVK